MTSTQSSWTGWPTSTASWRLIKKGTKELKSHLIPLGGSVEDVNCPARFAEQARKMGWQLGQALDPSMGFCFAKGRHRSLASTSSSPTGACASESNPFISAGRGGGWRGACDAYFKATPELCEPTRPHTTSSRQGFPFLNILDHGTCRSWAPWANDMIQGGYDEQEARGQAKVIAKPTNKSLFDSIHSEQAQGDDDRSTLDLAVIRESSAAVKGRAPWVPHNRILLKV